MKEEVLGEIKSAAELSLRQAKTCSGGLGAIHLAC